MPTCECGLEVKTKSVTAAHRAGSPHRCAMTQRYAEQLGLTARAPLQLHERYWARLNALGATGVFQKTLEHQRGFINTASKQTARYVTTELVAAAIHRLGVPSTDSSGRTRWQAPGSWKATAQEATEWANAMRAALVLYDVYGDDAVDVYWKVGVLAEDEDACQGVFDVLTANGVKRAAASLIDHAFDALMITEAERLNRRRAELAEIKAKKTEAEAA